MAKKIVLAGVAGGVVLFFWGAASHMALGLEATAIKEIPNEASVLSAMRDNIKDPGFSVFPGMGAAKDQQKWVEKWTAGPAGVLVYQTRGAQPMSPKQLGTEIAATISVPYRNGYGFPASFTLAQSSSIRSSAPRSPVLSLPQS